MNSKIRIKQGISIASIFFLLCLHNNCGNEFEANQSSTLDEDSNSNNDGNGDKSDSLEPKNHNAILAVGQMKSSMYSCDGGKTWLGYRTEYENARCGRQTDGSNIDCSHHADSPTGIAYDEAGTFISTYGWGRPGSVIRTTDGYNWEEVFSPGTGYFAGVSFGNGTFYLHTRFDNFHSKDAGESWTPSGDIMTNSYTSRSTFFIPWDGGRFVGTAGTADSKDIFISKDNTLTFTQVENLPDGCGNGKLAISNNRVMLLADKACISDDSGDTWTAYDYKHLGISPSATFMSNGTHFRIYNFGSFYETAENEMNWKETEFNVNGQHERYLLLGRITYDPKLKRYSSLVGSYEDTRHFWSDNGIDWNEIDTSTGDAPVNRHRMTKTALGFLQACSN